MPPTNLDPSASFQAVLNDAWNEAGHNLRVDSSGAFVATKAITFAGGTTNDPGNFGGTGTPWTLWTASGQLLVAVIAVCTVSLTGASSTFSVGVSGSVTKFLPTTTSTGVASGATVDHTGVVSAGTAPIITPNQAVLNGQVLIGTTGTANITAGSLTFYAFYKPLTAGATLS